MKVNTEKFLKLLFEPDEEVVVQRGQEATYSILQSQINEDETQLIAVNPIKGWRLDANCTAFRSFLIELDSMSIQDQYNYVKNSGMPYSAIVFSGNKSLHYVITLDKPILDVRAYKFCGHWIANIMKEADPQPSKVPSRGIRFPGHIRESTGKEQKLLEIHDRVKREHFNIWLNRHMDKKPVLSMPQKRATKPNPKYLANWAINELKNGIDESKGRNNRWFSLGFEFYMAGYDLEQTIQMLGNYFDPEPDFTMDEWTATIKHAFKKASGSVI